MDIGRAFGFVFEDEEWVSKVLLGAAILLIPIFGGFALLGYSIAVLHNVMADDPRPLPTWDNLGRYFTDGLMFWIVTVVYSLPFLIFICPMVVVWLPPALAGEQEELMNVLVGIAGVVSAGLGCLALLYGVLLGLLTPVVQIRYAEAGEIGACLRFGEVFRFLFAHIGPIIVSQMLVWLAGMVIASVVGGVGGFLGIIPICGWILAAALGLLMLPVSVWLMVFAGHLYGQIGRQARMSTAPSF